MMSKRYVLYLQLSKQGGSLPAELSRQGWQMMPALTPDHAWALDREHDFRVGVIDLSAAELSEEWRDFLLAYQHIRWIALLGRQSLERASVTKTIYDHCHDYHLLPIDGLRLSYSLGQAWGMAELCKQREPAAAEHRMVGRSEPMRRILRLIPRIAVVEAPVLVQGESGTGKELAAQAIHQSSRRAAGPFIAVNCGALPGALVHSELFGHERGAFTGATQRRIGRIEAANGGTLFLDEIGDLPLELQVNLLRFLQEGTIERLGAARSMSLDVRVITATHINLEQAVTKGAFREDLYYRLNVLRLTIPPLRERSDDIPLLAEHAFRQFLSESDGGVRGFSPQAVEAMQAYDWPGNVRELINRIRRATVLCDHPLITPSDLDLDRPQLQAQRRIVTLAKAREEAEKAAIQAALARYKHNYSLAARLLGISRTTLYRMLQRHTLDSR
ncbi:MAG: sigma-54 dependent transcriptional regulator [Aquisalimonadaceae bacterium]